MLTLLMIFGAILLRLIPHVPNFAPITALGLFGGVYLGKKSAIFIPLIAIIISDYLLGSLFHSTTLYVWGSFIISSLIGIGIKNHKKPQYIFTASLIASLQFFLITNFGVWKEGMYERGVNGLMESYIMGLPFFKWTLLGDFFYIVIFFGTYQLAFMVTKRLNIILKGINNNSIGSNLA